MRLREINMPDSDPSVLAVHSSLSASEPRSATDPLDDVFASSPSPPAARALEEPGLTSSHPSDIPRLRAEHATAGYREGITAAKAKSIQAGFDEGFSLGATVGSRAGQLLGTLEGIADALRVRRDDSSAEAERLLETATRELTKDAIFNPRYWDSDGTWKYDVIGSKGDTVLFADVAGAHPVIRQWTLIVEAEMQKCNMRNDVLGALPEELSQEREPTPEKGAVGLGLGSPSPLDW